MCVERLLTLELGVNCNNRCAFCPQHYLRCGALAGRNLSTAEALRRIAAGETGGFTRIAFTGGEPTVRTDLPELVGRAAQAGFTEISITTNGRMLAVENLTEQLLRAGLNRISFSLHSADADLHDRLTGVPGGFGQLAQGIATARRLAEDSGIDLVLHSVSLLLPQNVGHLTRTVECAATMGAGIHIVQPFVASSANLHVAAAHFVDYPTIAAAVAAAGSAAVALGSRVKPYNVPYCQLESLEGIELQQYGLATHRRQEEAAGDEGQFEQAQFYVIPRCPTCPTPCPGFRMEHYPSAEMAREIIADAAEFRARRLVVPALDLLDGEGLARVFESLGERSEEVVPLAGGPMWVGPQEFAAVAARAGVGEVAHLLRTDWEGDRTVEPDPGNDRAILGAADALRAQGVGSRLVVSVLDLVEFPYTFDALSPAFDGVVLVFPGRWRGLDGPEGCAAAMDRQGERALEAAAALDRVRPVTLAGFDNIRVLHRTVALWQRAFAGHFPLEDWSGGLVRHRFASARYNYVMWSYPFWLF